MTHNLKTAPEEFGAVWDGLKLAEFRKDDRDYQAGDKLCLNETDAAATRYTGRVVVATVRHVYRGRFLPEGFCMMTLDPVIYKWHGIDPPPPPAKG
jgi:hypothetical protein